ncbi:hypothetical protein WCP94_002515 [Bilophila wadsworthia]
MTGRGKLWGEGRGNLSGERFPLPSPHTPIPPLPKTFGLIESLIVERTEIFGCLS